MSNKYKSARKGIYKPRNPSKWIQDRIIYRSGLEQKYFTYFDLNPNVTHIASERIIVPYFDKYNNKYRKYYTDLLVKFKDKDNNIQVKLIEIKTFCETIKPKKPKRMTNNYKQAVGTYITNICKWEAATAYSKKKGWEFCVLTERNLKGLI